MDDAATDATGDDFAPLAVTKGIFNQGDANHNGLLDPGETWLYTSEGISTAVVEAGSYVNVATVSGIDQVTTTRPTMW